MERITRPDPEYEVPNIDYLVALFPGNKKYDWEDVPHYLVMGIASGRLKRCYEKRCNLKEALVFCTYRWTNRLKEFSSGSNYKEWKYYQVIIHNTYHGGNIETDHHVV